MLDNIKSCYLVIVNIGINCHLKIVVNCLEENGVVKKQKHSLETDIKRPGDPSPHLANSQLSTTGRGRGTH